MTSPQLAIPAKAGVQNEGMDSRFRGSDGNEKGLNSWL